MVYQTIVVAAALAGLAAGSPAPLPQMLDPNQINAAPVVVTGPGKFVLDEEVQINNNFTVTKPAAPAGSGLNKRTLGWNFGGSNDFGSVINTWQCLLFGNCQTAPQPTTTSCTTTAAAPKTTGAAPKTTAAAPKTTAASTSPKAATTAPATAPWTISSSTTTPAPPSTTPATTSAQATPVPSNTTAAPATTSPVSSASCGINGYDLQKPAAFWSDGSGQFGTLATCKAACQQQGSALSFAFGSNTCLCYAAPVTGNINPDSSSPYAFYDIGCGDSPSATTSTASSTSSADGACATQPEAGTYCGFINPEDPCAPQPDGNGPANLTVDAFLNNPDFKQSAVSAPSSINAPSGATYNKVFGNLNGAVSANSYLGLHTLTSYDVNGCAAYCDNTTLCTAFNIYVERDPALNPTKNDSTAPTVWGYWCPNPNAITNYKCTLWGSNLDASLATNMGGWRKDFQVVITGSDGYDKTNSTTPSCVVTPIGSTTPVSGSTLIPSSSSVPSTIAPVTTVPTTTGRATTAAATSGKTTTPGKSSTTMSTTVKTTSSPSPSPYVPSIPKWKPGRNCGGKAVNKPGQWMGGKVFPGPYNPQVCADYVSAQNAVNKAAAVKAGLNVWTPCEYFNAVFYHKNGVPYGTYCNLYNNVIDSSYETYLGGWVGRDNYSCKQSWTFELDVDLSFGTC